MRILAIESSCDDTGAAVVEDGRKILSNVLNSQVEEHKKYGGVVPEIASRRHTENICAVVRGALDGAGLSPAQLDGVAVTFAPGLIGSLLVGVNFAKGFAAANGLPLVGVHHLRSHIAANYLAHPELKPPFLCLVVSGGNSHIVEVQDYTWSAIRQARASIASINLVSKRPDQFGKSMLFPAMVETYAIFALLISILAVTGINSLAM